jgi:hypothetical protein
MYYGDPQLCRFPVQPRYIINVFHMLAAETIVLLFPNTDRLTEVAVAFQSTLLVFSGIRDETIAGTCIHILPSLNPKQFDDRSVHDKSFGWASCLVESANSRRQANQQHCKLNCVEMSPPKLMSDHETTEFQSNYGDGRLFKIKPTEYFCDSLCRRNTLNVKMNAQRFALKCRTLNYSQMPTLDFSQYPSHAITYVCAY